MTVKTSQDFPENPPAFPGLRSDGDKSLSTYEGMDLRDYFAAKCLEGFFSQPDTPLPPGQTIEQVRQTACASWYAWADAMLLERGK